MFSKLYIILFLLLVTSCNRKINQYKNGERSGLWVMKDTVNSKWQGYKGHYRKGQERGKWKYYRDGKVFRIERYKGKIAYVKLYYPNAKIMERGKTMTEINEKGVHWYYIGDWNYYDKTGNISAIKTFNKGEITQEITIKK